MNSQTRSVRAHRPRRPLPGDAERLEKRRDVVQLPQYPEAHRRVLVGHHQKPLRLGPHLAAPLLPIGDEERLLRLKARHRVLGLQSALIAPIRAAHRVVRDVKTTQVGDVLPQRGLCCCPRRVFDAGSDIIDKETRDKYTILELIRINKLFITT